MMGVRLYLVTKIDSYHVHIDTSIDQDQLRHWVNMQSDGP